MNPYLKAGSGRPKGSPNRFGAKVKQMVFKSLQHRGGQKWLDDLETEEFCKLLRQVVPKETQVAGEDGGPINIKIVDFKDENA